MNLTIEQKNILRILVQEKMWDVKNYRSRDNLDDSKRDDLAKYDEKLHLIHAAIINSIKEQEQ